MGVLSNTLYQVFFMYGLTHTSVANASLIVATTPLIVAFLGAATGIEALRRPVVTGGLLGFSGVALILAGKGAELGVGRLAGDAAVFGATLCWAVFTLGVRALRVRISTLRLTTWTMVTGAPGLLLLGAPSLRALDWGGRSARGRGAGSPTPPCSPSSSPTSSGTTRCAWSGAGGPPSSTR